MPSVRCPGCDRVLRFEDSVRGEHVVCPVCHREFAVGRTPQDDEPVDEFTSYKLQDEPDEADEPSPVTVTPTRVHDLEDRTRPRIRKRRRRRPRSRLPGFLADWNLDKVLLVGSVGFWLVLLGLALIHEAFVIGLFICGAVLLVVSRIWGSMAAADEGSGMGCLMLISPYYFLANLFVLDDKRPLFLFVVGVVYVLTGVTVGFTLYSHG